MFDVVTDWAFPSHLIQTMLINGFLFYFSFFSIISVVVGFFLLHSFHLSNAGANDNDNVLLRISIAAGAAAADDVVEYDNCGCCCRRPPPRYPVDGRVRFYTFGQHQIFAPTIINVFVRRLREC